MDSSVALVFLDTFINSGYYLCFIPFRITCYKKSCVFHTNIFQKVLCFIVHCCALWIIGVEWAKFSNHNIHTNAKGTFVHYGFILVNVGSVISMYILWKKRNVFQWMYMEIVQTYQGSNTGISIGVDSGLAEKWRPKRGVKLLGISVASALIFLSIFNSVTIDMTLSSFEDYFSREMRQKIWKDVYYLFFLSPSSESYDESLMDFFLLILYLIIKFFFYTAFHYGDYMFITITIVIGRIVNSFVAKLENNQIPVNKVISSYLKVKEFSNRFNEQFGLLVLVFVCSGIPYFSTHLVSFFENPKNMHSFITIIYSLYFFIFLLYASKLHRKIKHIKNWFYIDNRASMIPQQEFALFLDDVTTCDIGINGYTFFTLSYSFVGTIVSLVITYFLIVLQFSSPSSSCSSPFQNGTTNKDTNQSTLHF